MTGGASCALCPGACRDADLTRLLTGNLQWLWEQLAERADRRGDRALDKGTVTITAPPQAARRAAALGLLGSVPLAAGQRKRLDLAALTTRLRGHGPALTSAAVAAHAASRPLGQEAAGRARHAARLARWQARHRVLLSALPATAPLRPDPEAAWAALRRTGWVSRLAAAPDPDALLNALAAVLTRLPATGRADPPPPGPRRDRRPPRPGSGH